jgi:hypothetical protein
VDAEDVERRDGRVEGTGQGALRFLGGDGVGVDKRSSCSCGITCNGKF